MKSPAIFVVRILISFKGISQNVEGITTTIDELTKKWDAEAKVYKTYEGMRDVCKSQPHRAKTMSLVKEIHHYDSLLFKTVSAKYDQNEDEEAKQTLRDIKKLESDYTTKSFLEFIHEECSSFNTIEKNYGRAKGKTYEKEIAKMEKVLEKYVNEITYQIDIIDEHIHHLQGK